MCTSHVHSIISQSYSMATRLHFAGRTVTGILTALYEQGVEPMEMDQQWFYEFCYQMFTPTPQGRSIALPNHHTILTLKERIWWDFLKEEVHTKLIVLFSMVTHF